jgi:hypothetical protein
MQNPNINTWEFPVSKIMQNLFKHFQTSSNHFKCHRTSTICQQFPSFAPSNIQLIQYEMPFPRISYAFPMHFPCVFCEDNYGKLLLSALPVAELRRMGRGLGTDAKFRKGCLVEKLCAAATKQRLLQTKQKPYEAVEAEIRGV